MNFTGSPVYIRVPASVRALIRLRFEPRGKPPRLFLPQANQAEAELRLS